MIIDLLILIASPFLGILLGAKINIYGHNNGILVYLEDNGRNFRNNRVSCNSVMNIANSNI